MSLSKRSIQTALLFVLLVPLPALSQATGRTFVPEEFFAGRSEGKGQMRLGPGKSRAFTVESVGTAQADGRLQVEQQVKFDGKPVQTRTWVMWKTGPGRYSATLTGAAGPVVGRIEGSRLKLRYPLKRWGLVMHQTLDVSGDGRTVMNYGSIRFLGIRVGRLRETIRLTH